MTHSPPDSTQSGNAIGVIHLQTNYLEVSKLNIFYGYLYTESLISSDNESQYYYLQVLLLMTLHHLTLVAIDYFQQNTVL